jgi:hypothetical protein
MSNAKLTKKERETFKSEIIDFLKSTHFGEILVNTSSICGSNWITKLNCTEFKNELVKKLSLNFTRLDDSGTFEYLRAWNSEMRDISKPLDPKKFDQIHFKIYLTRNSRKYLISTYGDFERNLKILESAPLDEIEARKKKRDTDYIIIERNGKKALVKFIEGDRDAIPSGKFIKRSKVDLDDEKTMRLLFKLNDDLKGKGR